MEVVRILIIIRIFISALQYVLMDTIWLIVHVHVVNTVVVHVIYQIELAQVVT